MMDACGCVYAGDYETMQYFQSKDTKSRGKVKCGECGKVIKKGIVYEHASGKAEGEWEDHRTCPVCLEIREAFFCEGGAFGEILGDLRESLWENDGSVPHECLADLSEKARGVVCDMIEEIWADMDEDGAK